jgi:hypothetical protein
MTQALLHPPAPVGAQAELVVDREDITFTTDSAGRVRIAITVRNEGPDRSLPSFSVLHAAPLGAFVPCRPLAALMVPALGPGESAVLRTEAPRPAPKPLGPPDRVPPRRLLTALGAEDEQRRDQIQQPQLPNDPLQLLARGSVYWAGNLNVFVGREAVERHVAQALRVYPGRTNLAMFVVGAGPDAYRFRLEGDAVSWEAKLLDMSESLSLADLGGAKPVDSDDWLRVHQQRLMFLSLCPPEACSQGKVEVHVEQRSTGKVAVVEFDLDPRAAGAGCYVVA